VSLVTFQCPNTGNDVSTGIETDVFTFTLLPDVVIYSLCPACGVEHAWRKRNAKLAGISGHSQSQKPAA
jgi:predicted RNA-binding Zn-ribbon protein involved in translation (DUF1610 family)